LEEGMQIDPITMNLSDAQFLESRRFSVEEICRVFRVPPHLIGDLSRSTNNNIEHQSIEFVTHRIRPWCVRIE
ncbi:phage portal protein, partial [Brachyspira hampsonii]|uniref:phage portal protein n=1 Tax=Brachyspira hampsonii TaxID=1287055 RepID=UPI001C67E6B3